VSESLYLNGVRGTLWRDPETGRYVVSIPDHGSFEAASYQQAMAWWEEAAATLAGQ